MRYLACLLALFLATAAPAQDTAVNREDVVRLLQRMHEVVPVRDQFVELGFRGENLELAMAQHQRIFGDRKVAEYMADRLIAAYDGRLPPASATGGLVGSLIDRGIGYLPTRDLVYFYRVENTVFKALSDRECGLAVKQRLSDRRLSDATAQAAARLNTPALKEYYRIQYKAVKLGLTREPKRLSAAEADAIEERIGKAIFSRTGDKSAMALIRVFENPRRATNRQACDAARTIMDTVLTLKGNDLRNALIYFSAP